MSEFLRDKLYGSRPDLTEKILGDLTGIQNIINDLVGGKTPELLVDQYRTPLDADEATCIITAMKEANKRGGGTVKLGNKGYTTALLNQPFYSNVTLVGGGPLAKVTMTKTGSLFVSSGQQAIAIKDIIFEGIDNNSLVLAADTTTGISITGCKVKNIRLIKTNLATGETYTTADLSKLNSDIYIVNNRAAGLNKSLSSACIELRYVKSVTVKDNNISRYQHGIQWWGGDSNISANGALTNPRWAIDLTISNNIIDDIGLGGIWGSMGVNITIDNGNKVSNCGDVGIDPEGCLFVSIVANKVKNCVNGGITTFFLNKGVVVTGNTIESDVDGQYLFKVRNSANSGNHSIEFTDNVCIHTGTGIGYIGGEQVDSLIITDNQLTNVGIQLNSLNYVDVKIGDNQLLFSNVSSAAFNAINSRYVTSDGKITVKNNTVKSKVAQPTGSRGVYVTLKDYNSATRAIVEGNEIEGFDIDLETLADSGNAGVTPKFVIRNNMLGNKKYVRSEGTTQKSKVLLIGNYDKNGDPFPSAIPTSGKWDAGQKIEYLAPSAGGKIGAICVTGGSPGTWKDYGAIDA
ncbi:hypothetical protein CPT_Moonbeam29 [Bacillus phage Moonbeam]|uniref:Right handed beta helix domain-containing protein n=1 Tax=Bacillus phage Moonbeam TaxID=1540091 RepID=A0A0A0RN35_9CAUD|nr:hypothetical protein CPT_Moonbeam29 [Bacillus phage Moonbeam]AIW03427.1 hypothetical protein CPT_Moonbeam29 [Bacillus phage Moonbeam]